MLRIRRLVAALAVVVVVPVAACQVFLENSTKQCSADGDCSAFPGAVCDLSSHLCVSAGGQGGGSCVHADGCYACAPTNDEQFLDACTDAKCIKFDRTRLTNLTADGGLPGLP